MADSELTGFETKVLAMIGALQPGDIVTYGEVAAEVGKPGAARAVGSTLRRHGSGCHGGASSQRMGGWCQAVSNAKRPNSKPRACSCVTGAS